MPQTYQAWAGDVVNCCIVNSPENFDLNSLHVLLSRKPGSFLSGAGGVGVPFKKRDTVRQCTNELTNDPDENSPEVEDHVNPVVFGDPCSGEYRQ